MKQKPLIVKPIVSAEAVFQFLKDINEQRQKEIRLEESVRRLSMDVRTLNLN